MYARHSNKIKNARLILPVIVVSQFAGTSLWFAGNAVIADLQRAFQLPDSAIGYLTSAVQLGFISGTLTFALLTISDRFSPSKVFFICALAGAFFNLSLYLFAQGFASVLALRVTTGFFLAGIYPVGMKIASDHHERGLGKSLGYLVGALVVGTAFPHLLKRFTESLSWEYVFILTSVCAGLGGLLMLLIIPDGPYRRKSSGLNITAFLNLFQSKNFRSVAFGYFGHMWELYTFWAFVPVILSLYNKIHNSALDISLLSFIIIGIGGLACVIGGYMSERFGSAKVAFTALTASGACCLLSPLAFNLPEFLFIIYLLFWGMTVIADSPQFSTLVAQRADKTIVGTALTIVNSIGFSITIVSIQFTNYMMHHILPQYLYVLLLPGPIFGLWAMFRQIKNPS
ncbi:MAG: MFS transporter [Saprospiraceae bacterium]|nr:MFS transporter [Saprospiraceae bacterium]